MEPETGYNNMKMTNRTYWRLWMWNILETVDVATRKHVFKIFSDSETFISE